MKYRFLKHTQRHRKGQTAELNSGAVQTKQLLARGFIEPVEPPAEKRETKPLYVEETKVPATGDDQPKRRKRRKSAEVSDATSTDE